MVPNYPLRRGGLGYVGHPALADPVFAKATIEVLTAEAMDMVDGILDGRLRPRSPFFAVPLLRTNFWRGLGAAGVVAIAAGAAWLELRRRRDA
jgi:hypothetical protein